MKIPKFKYQDFIDKSKVKGKIDEKVNRRYILEIPFKGILGDNALVILKNPSCANITDSDLTINRIINYIHKNRATTDELNNISKIIVVNLFAYYSTDSSKLEDVVKQHNEDYLIGNDDLSVNDCREINRNDDIIKDAISQSSIIIAAWGNSPDGIRPLYKSRVETVKGFIKASGKKSQVFYVDCLSNEGNPKHAQVWGYEDKMLKYQEL